MSYNGFTNWETWNVALWIDNDEYIYNKRFKYRAVYGKTWNKENVKYFFNRYFNEKTPDMKSKLQIEKVNWQEIANLWNEEEL